MTRIAVAGQALIKEPVAPDSAAGEALVDLLSAADLAISNFEGTLADDGAVPTKSGVVHAADPSTPAGLKALGVSAVTVANNHLYDFGASGVLASLSAIAGAGFLAAGAGADLDAAAAPAFTQAGGLRLALIGADCGPQADVVYAAARHAGIACAACSLFPPPMLSACGPSSKPAAIRCGDGIERRSACRYRRPARPMTSSVSPSRPASASPTAGRSMPPISNA